MESEEGRTKSELKEKVFKICSDFMIRVTKFEELVSVGNKLLIGFQQGLDFLRRPPIDKTSELVERIIKANETKRVSSYVKAGCVNIHDNVQNISKSKGVVKELECLLEDVTDAMKNALPHLLDKDIGNESDHLATTDTKELVPSDLPKPEVTDFAAAMAIIYTMVKQDYVMQEKIISSLGLKSSSGELESYCLMWSLRPFIDDEIMHQAWKLIP